MLIGCVTFYTVRHVAFFFFELIRNFGFSDRGMVAAEARHWQGIGCALFLACGVPFLSFALMVAVYSLRPLDGHNSSSLMIRRRPTGFIKDATPERSSLARSM